MAPTDLLIHRGFGWESPAGIPGPTVLFIAYYYGPTDDCNHTLVHAGAIVDNSEPRTVQKLNSGQFPSPAMSTRGASFRGIKDRFSFRGLPGRHALRLGTTACNQPRNGPRTAPGRGPTHLLMITPSEFVCPPSGRLTIVVIQHSAQPLAALNRSTVCGTGLCLDDQPVAQPLVVALAMVVFNKFMDGLP